MDEQPPSLEPLTPSDQDWVRRLTAEVWGDARVVAHGVIYTPEKLPGFALRQGNAVIGFVTYQIDGDTCEIVTLFSLVQGKGFGAQLVQAVEAAARQAGCRSLWLITTNDNLNAFRFYQKRGFCMTVVFPGAVASTRQLKPSIPLIGEDGIPIRDEIRFEKTL